MRGRKPKPTALKLVAGNPGKRKIDAAEMNPRTIIGDPPDWLSDHARKEWFAIVAEIKETGVLKSVDTQCLAIYCTAVGVVQEMEEILQKDGHTVTTDKGNIAKHPAWNIQREAALVAGKFASDFGLTPAARVRVKVPNQEKEKDPMAEFLLRNQKAG